LIRRQLPADLFTRYASSIPAKYSATETVEDENVRAALVEPDLSELEPDLSERAQAVSNG
jgi:hypothetical protein